MRSYKKFPLLLAAVAAVGLSACGGNDNPINDVLPSGVLRVANAVPDSNPIDAEIEGIPSNIDNIAFGTASGERDVAEGNYRINLTTNTGNNSDVSFTLDPTNVDDDHVTVVYAVGRIGNGSQEAFEVISDDNELNNSQSEVQFVHAAKDHPTPVDFFLTAPADPISAATATVDFKDSSTQQSFTPGNSYRIRVTGQGVPGIVLFDSGTISLPAASAQQFALINNATTGTYALLVLDGLGQSHKIENAP